MTSSSSSVDVRALPCNVAFRASFAAILDPVAQGDFPLGATILGRVDPAETRTVSADQTLLGDVFLLQQATLTIQNGGRVEGNIYAVEQSKLVIIGGTTAPTSVAANVYMFDNSSLDLQKDKVDVAQEYVGQYLLIALDESTVNIHDVTLSHGEMQNVLHTQILCGGATGSISHVDYTQGTAGQVAVFTMDQSHYSLVDSSASLFEMTLADASQMTISQMKSPVGIYFDIKDATVVEPLTLAPANPATLTASLQYKDQPGPTAHIVNSNIFYGLWFNANASFKLVDSLLPMFARFSDNATVAGLAPGMHGPDGETTVPFSDRSVRLMNTHVLLWNVYMEGDGQLDLFDSTVGELACLAANSRRHLTGTIIDGSGGYMSARNGAELSMQGGTLSANLITSETSTAHLRGVDLRGRPDNSASILQANDSSLIALEDTVPAQTPPVQLQPNGQGAIVFALMDQPAVDSILGNTTIVTGAALVMAEASSPHVLGGYDLVLVDGNGATVVDVAHASTPVDFSVLGTLERGSVPAGSYVLRLDVRNGAHEVMASTSHNVTFP